MNNIQSIKDKSIVFVPALINLLIIVWVDATSIFSFFYTLCLFFLANRFLVKDHGMRRNNALIMQLYIFLAIVLYLVQLANIPDYFGMSGASGSTGTDDHRYMAMISDNPLLIDLYPGSPIHEFARFLKILYPFPVRWPLNIVIPNLLGMVFLPYLTYLLSDQLFPGCRSVSKKAYSLTIWCPFIMFAGLILMRDTWVASFYLCGMICFLKKKYIGLIVVSALLFFLRSGSFVLLALAIIIYSRHLLRLKYAKETARKVYVLSLIGFFVAFIALYQYFPLLFEYQFTGSITRDSFVESYLSQFENSSLYKISLLPIFIRIPAITLFFLFTPFLKGTIYTEGIFNLRMILLTIASPLYFVYHSKAFFRAIPAIRYESSGSLKDTFLLIIISCTLLGLSSLQLRHKVPLMPLFYIVMAYGYCRVKQPAYKISGIVLAVLLLIGQLVHLLFF